MRCLTYLKLTSLSLLTKYHTNFKSIIYNKICFFPFNKYISIEPNCFYKYTYVLFLFQYTVACMINFSFLFSRLNLLTLSLKIILVSLYFNLTQLHIVKKHN